MSHISKSNALAGGSPNTYCHSYCFGGVGAPTEICMAPTTPATYSRWTY